MLRPMDRKAARKKLDALSAQYGLHVDWDAKVEDLSVGVQQRIEILKLLYRDAQILILDEPTAVLTPQETLDLFENLKKLCEQGKTVIIITHKLKEVMNLAKRVTVFRAGRVVAEREIHETNIEDLAMLMVGRKVNLEGEVPPAPLLRAPVLEMDQVSWKGPRKLANLSLKVHGGEIVGIAGVEGNGQAELIQMLLHPKEQGESLEGSIQIHGRSANSLAADEIKLMGVGVVPDDRLRDALLLDRSVKDNYLLGLQRRTPFCKKGMISAKAVEDSTQNALNEYDIRPKLVDATVSGLSGGNQQKLVIAREFRFSPKFLIAAQPTRGVDVGSIEFIHKRIFQARAEGTGVLLISSELDEILALSDRILVMYEGKFFGKGFQSLH